MSGIGGNLNVRIWRGNRGGGSLVGFPVPSRENQTVLDVVTWVHRNLESGLAYRFACRVGMCGSCAMMVNGVPRWTCRTHVQKVARDKNLTIEPLRNFQVIKDLVCDMSDFFGKWNDAGGHFHPKADQKDRLAVIPPEDPRRKAASAAIECINCGICHSACDVVASRPDYLGPAALNRAWSLTNDARDCNRRHRLRSVIGKGGCQNCHSQQGCSAFCPAELNPTASIAGLKREAARALAKGRL